MATLCSTLYDGSDLRYQPLERRVRGLLGRSTVVDSDAPVLVWRPGGIVPSWAFPEADVRVDALPADALRRYDDPDLAGLVTVAWRAVDRWFEEDEEAIGHPRDPFKRIDVRRSSRRVEVRLDGELLADSTRPRLLFETGLPTRYYLPPEDVRTELLVPSDSRSICPYKGEASYRSVTVGDTLHEDLVWFYPFPISDAVAVADLLCFYNEKVDLSIDGQPVPRPASPFS